MPDIIGQILQRLDALEAAMKGRASEHFDRKLFKAEVALREGVVAHRTRRRGGTFPAARRRHQRSRMVVARHAGAARPCGRRQAGNNAHASERREEGRRGRSARDAALKGFAPPGGQIPEARNVKIAM